MYKFFLLFLLMFVLLIQTYQAKELLDDNTVIGKIDGKVVKFKDFKDLEIQKLIEELHRLVQINFQNKVATEIVKKEKIYTLSSLNVNLFPTYNIKIILT